MPQCSDDSPRLRGVVPELLHQKEETLVALRDPSRIQAYPVLISPLAYRLTCLMDGRTSRCQILEQAQQHWGIRLELSQLQRLIDSLDERLLLDNANSRQHLAQRPAAHAGSAYPDQPQPLRDFLERLLEPRPPAPIGPAGAYLLPHIDLQRGQASYAQGWNQLAPQIENFDLFVILGISHAYCEHPFILSRTQYQTPLGSLSSDLDQINRLAEDLPFDPFLDEFNHFGEHSIEFQLVFLQHLKSQPFQILPILCGSFQPFLEGPDQPQDDPKIQAFIGGLQRLAQRPRTCWLASVDLAHLGQRFGGSPLNPESLARLAQLDRATLAQATLGNAQGFLESLRQDQGQRNYCGTSAIYSLLRALEPPPGQLLHYQQCNEPGLTSTVTVASVSFPWPGGSAS